MQKLNANEAEREIAERRYMDLLSLEYAKKYEREEGKKEGEKERSIEIAKKSKELKLPLETIVKLTGLTKEEIEKL